MKIIMTLHEAGGGDLLQEADSSSRLPAHWAGIGGHSQVLITIAQLGYNDTFAVAAGGESTVVHFAIQTATSTVLRYSNPRQHWLWAVERCRALIAHLGHAQVVWSTQGRHASVPSVD